MDIIIQSFLKDLYTVEITVTSFRPLQEEINFLLFKDHKKSDYQTLILVKKDLHHQYYRLLLKEAYDFSMVYNLSCVYQTFINIDLSGVIEFEEFDYLFNYDGPLGNFYNPDYTLFYLWAPLASDTYLKLENDSDFIFLKMHRLDKGVYCLKVNGDLKNKKYHYIVNNFGHVNEVNDIYATGVNLNSEYSVVIDLKELETIAFKKPKNKINNYVDATIYELHIKDFTLDKNTNIKNKGKYLGLIEENAKTKLCNPAGLDYLKYLGISHIQLQPILDYGSVLDNDDSTYNWGYDPISFMALEGSFSLEPDNAITRLKEFKTMVAKLHENNIRVNVDVVYNHIYKVEESAFEKIVPHYYFRKAKNGKYANASGCGNDYASERYMARRYIIDSASYLVKTFDIDGFRFDLMGLIDIKTINTLVSKCLSIKNDLMFYGEGWNMGEELSFKEKACSENAHKLPHVAFFNDTYRNIVKGGAFINELKTKGFALGDYSYRYGLDFVYHGSILNLSYDPIFTSANQSLNFIECHDNTSLFDKIRVCNEEELFNDRIKLSNAILLTSFGIPFIHMGQEIGLDKKGHDNSYNIPNINNFNYDLLDKNFSLATNLKTLIALRKEKLKYLSLVNKEDIEKIFQIIHTDNELYILKSCDLSHICDFKELYIIINNSKQNKNYEFGDYYHYLLLKGDGPSVKNAIISPSSLLLFYKN